MSLAAGGRLGPYEILAPLGAGGMGEVYRARDTRLDRNVAIKILPTPFAEDVRSRARFEREAKLLASLNHPGIAHLYGFEAAILPDGKEVHLLAMELVEGEDLATRLARGKLSLDEAIDVARQVAEALEEAHEHGIVHRDLKPANVKRTSDGKAKLLDFGLAKAWAGEGPSGSASVDLSQSPTLPHTGTQAGVILGTAAYMSPEQARGKAVDRRSDIWAFGVVLFEMLSGRRLFQGETVSDTLAAVLGQEMPWAALPARTPTRLRQLLQRCLERDPRQRLRDIGEARIVLGNMRTLDEADSSPAAPRATARLPRRLIRSLPSFLVAATVLAVSMWAIRTRSPREAGSPSVQHFDLAFPANIHPLPSLANTIALSPDGRMVATVGVKDGTRRLFVRRLDTAEITEISETVGVTGTTFSPDGKKIAFCCQTGLLWFSFSDRQRSRVALDGDLGSGLAWGEPGIVFTRDSALWIAPAPGGEPRPLTTLDVQRHEVLHTGPIFLPGDRTVLFTSFTTVPGAERIEAIAVDGGSRHVVVERATTPRWSSTGHLLFEREGAVLAAPFDGQTTSVTGSATPVLPSGLVGRTRVGLLAFQVGGNGALLFMPADFDAERLVSVARDGSARTLGLPRGHYASPRIAPDGRRVMVERKSSAFEVLSLERGTSALLTTAVPGTSQGVWSRDGTRIAFRRHAIFWKAADGSDQQGEVKGSAATDYPTGPGPDGDSILVVRLRPETSGDVYLLSLSGAFAPRPLIESKAYEGGAQLSPDGRWLVYASNETGAFEIHVRTFPELDRQWSASESGGTQPRWSASGREIYYRDGRHLMAVPFDGRGREPLVGKAQALFDDEYDLGLSTTIAMYDVTPDGHFLMLRREAGGGHLRIVLNWTEELKRILAEHAR